MKVEIINIKQPKNMKPIPVPNHFKRTVRKCAFDIKKNPGRGCKSYKYVQFFQDWDGEILETIYSVKYDRPKKKSDLERIRTQLVFAGTPTRRWSSGNLLYSRLSGYFVLWDENEGRSGFIKYYGYDPKIYECADSDWHPSLQAFSDSNPLEKEEMILSLRNWPPYFDVYQMMHDCCLGSIIEYIKRFTDYKDLELLQKAGISYLWDSNWILKAKPAQRKKILTYIKTNIEAIRGRHPAVSFIQKAMRLGMTIEQYEWHEVVQAVEKTLCGIDGYFMREEANEVAKYIQKQNGGPIHYRDYLDLSVKMGRNINDRGVLFPKDFCKQFDELKRAYDIQQNKELEERIKKSLEQLGVPMTLKKKRFTVQVLDSYEKLIDMGNALHNCVGTCGYGAQMADGTIVILGVYENGKPVNCVELLVPGKSKYGKPAANQYKVLQNRGDHNQDSPVQKEAESVVSAYIVEANRMWRQSHATA